MIRMVNIKKQSFAFCKYSIARLLWLAIIFTSTIPVYNVFGLMLISAFVVVDRSPLVVLYNLTFAKWFHTSEVYINIHSMRFSYIVGCIFCVLSLVSYYFVSQIVALVLVIIFAILQSIASCGYCSAQKLYECVICNSNCCRFGKKVKDLKNKC